MSLSVRIRFEVFKRDGFTCKYCGGKSPAVVLQVDHVVPVAAGGTDDPLNLVTSCWACNMGKSDKPLNQLIATEDPTERAVMLLERERQLKEYNKVLEQVRKRVSKDLADLVDYWCNFNGHRSLGASDESWLEGALERWPKATIQHAMSVAIRNRKTYGLSYVNAILRNKKQRGEI